MRNLILILSLILAPLARAQEVAPASFDKASADAQARLEASLVELSRLRETLAAEKLPLARRLSDLESQLSSARAQYQQTTRLLDNRTLDLSNLRTELKARQDEADYLSTLLGEYARNFESRLHIGELQRYRAQLDAVRLASENTALAPRELFDVQLDLLDASLERLREGLGGSRFEGTALDPNGLVQRGTFLLLGPVAVFKSAESDLVGTVEQRLGSLEPSVVVFADPLAAAAASATIASGSGELPLDPTLGNAHKIEATQETIWEHIVRGGPVMLPIFVLAGAALLVALYKWASLAFVRNPSGQRVTALLAAVARHDREAALREAQAMRGPTGAMLLAGVQHLDEPRELIGEVMYETVLATRLKLQGFLPFIAICASSAPLLGLLGTVTGIMNTFTLMTVFGTGDVKTLSSGISEALITTEYGLIVAIPSLLIHAFLSRKAKSVIDQMEKSAIALTTQVGKTPLTREPEVVRTIAPAGAHAHEPVDVVLQPARR